MNNLECLHSLHHYGVWVDVRRLADEMVAATGMQGPEIRTGFLKDPDTPVIFTAGKTIKITTDYEHKGDGEMISMRYAPSVSALTPPQRPVCGVQLCVVKVVHLLWPVCAFALGADTNLM